MMVLGARAFSPPLLLAAAAAGIGGLTILSVLLPSIVLSGSRGTMTQFHDPGIRLHAPTSRPLSTYRAIWLHPLFNQNREKDPPPPPPPPPPKPKPPDASQYALFGIVTSPTMQVALVRRAGSQDTIHLRVNDALDGWSVVGIQADRISLSDGDATASLQMAKPSSLPHQSIETAATAQRQNE